MPTKVTIHVIGLCLCFLKEDPPHGFPREKIWQILFPCDERHELSFGFPQPDDGGHSPSNPTSLHVPDKDLILDFIIANPTSGPAAFDNTFGQLLNLADDDLHGKTPNGKHSRLNVRRKLNPKEADQVRMRVPKATLTVGEPKKFSWLLELGTTLPNLVFKDRKADAVTLEFSFEGKLQVKACDGRDCTTFDETFTGTGTDLTFTINNKCTVNDGGNDSLDFYECVREGPNEPGKRFLSGKFDFSLVDLEHMDAMTRFGKVATLIRDILKPESNCDPVGSEPPPGP